MWEAPENKLELPFLLCKNWPQTHFQASHDFFHAPPCSFCIAHKILPLAMNHILLREVDLPPFTSGWHCSPLLSLQRDDWLKCMSRIPSEIMFRSTIFWTQDPLKVIFHSSPTSIMVSFQQIGAAIPFPWMPHSCLGRHLVCLLFSFLCML